ncbi:hypothetical protein BDW69DRAFT_167275 [Aspergillus filifer]
MKGDVPLRLVSLPVGDSTHVTATQFICLASMKEAAWLGRIGDSYSCSVYFISPAVLVAFTIIPKNKRLSLRVFSPRSFIS